MVAKTTLKIGDCTELMPNFPGEDTVDLIITDPPYKGLDYKHGFGVGKRVDKSDNDTFNGYIHLNYDYGYVPFNKWLHNARMTLKRTGNIIIFELPKNIFDVKEALEKNGFIYRQYGVWHVPNKAPVGIRRPQSAFEVWVWGCKSQEYFYRDGTNIKDVIYQQHETYASNSDEEISSFYVGGKKPIELLRPLIRTFSPENGTVLDPFAGTGSTGLASRIENRECYLIEINQKLEEYIKNKTMLEQQGIFSFHNDNIPPATDI